MSLLPLLTLGLAAASDGEGEPDEEQPPAHSDSERSPYHVFSPTYEHPDSTSHIRIPAWAQKAGLVPWTARELLWAKMLEEIIPFPEDESVENEDEARKRDRQLDGQFLNKLTQVRSLRGFPDEQNSGPCWTFLYDPPIIVQITRITSPAGSSDSEHWDTEFDIAIREYRPGAVYPRLDRMIYVDGPTFGIRNPEP